MRSHSWGLITRWLPNAPGTDYMLSHPLRSFSPPHPTILVYRCYYVRECHINVTRSLPNLGVDSDSESETKDDLKKWSATEFALWLLHATLDHPDHGASQVTVQVLMAPVPSLHLSLVFVRDSSAQCFHWSESNSQKALPDRSVTQTVAQKRPGGLPFTSVHSELVLFGCRAVSHTAEGRRVPVGCLSRVS